MKQNKTTWIFSILWLLLIGWLAFLWHLGSTGLVDETEPLFAEAARQMTVTGDWVTPYFNGETRFDKPPLIYWLMAIAYQLFGVNEWAVRLPSAIGAIALMSFGFYTLLATQDNKSKPKSFLLPCIGAALIALNSQTIVWARTGVSDMLLTSCMGISLLSFFLGYTFKDNITKKSWEAPFWYLVCYIFLALSVLTKGPVGIVLPGLIIISFLLYTGNLTKVIKEMEIIKGLIIFMVMTLPWYILVIRQHGWDYINSFFGYHNFQRFTEVVNGHGASWYFYFLVVLVGFIPWSIYLPVAILRVKFWHRSWWCQQPRGSQLSLFAFFWFSGIFIFFTIAVTKLPSYTLPLLPASAILVALFWSEAISTANPKRSMNRGLLISCVVNVIVLVILAIFFLKSPNFIGYDPAAPNLAELVALSGIPLRTAIIWGATAIAIALVLWLRYNWKWIFTANLIAFIAFLVFTLLPTAFLIDGSRQLSLRELSAIVVQRQKPEEEVVMIGFKKPSLTFYTQRRVKFFRNTNKAIAYLTETTDIEANSTSLLIVARPKYIQRVVLDRSDYQILGFQSPYLLLRVDKHKILRH
ncbi:MAG: glycosyltransferase family 39 protein [Prochloron sp. SP5CPC1]|nr:glycosyltransferase family 39 protein [Candidatus Paraprochloron terpiosi SP5CPC1]